MKYTARFVCYYYDEFDTTLCDIYDIKVDAKDSNEALAAAWKILDERSIKHSNPGESELVSLADESGRVCVLLNNQLTILPREEHDKIPQSFCLDGETHYTIDERGRKRMVFPKPKRTL